MNQQQRLECIGLLHADIFSTFAESQEFVDSYIAGIVDSTLDSELVKVILDTLDFYLDISYTVTVRYPEHEHCTTVYMLYHGIDRIKAFAEFGKYADEITESNRNMGDSVTLSANRDVIA